MSSTHQDFSGPITSDKPAQSGEIIHLYASGFGPVTPPVPDGAPAPASPLSRTVNPVTCGALDASGKMIPLAVLFAGLTPGQTGVYQLDVELLGSPGTGNAVQVRCGVGSNTSSIAVPVHQ
jgi:uncharacterized protein (TIGR03437 family)